MTITERTAGAVSVLTLTGKLTSDDSGQLKGKVTSLMDAGRTKIVINLAAVSYIDSSGLGELVSCHTTAKQKGAVKLANLGKRIQDLLVMTKLMMVFDVYNSEDEAIKSFESAA